MIVVVVDKTDKYLFDIKILLATRRSLHDWHDTFGTDIILNLAGVCGLLVSLLLVLGME